MRVLIVDDSKPMRNLVKRTMIRAGYANHAYELAGNGEEAIALFDSFPPDLILADWNMPVMNGLALLEYVKANKPNIKLGFVTSEQTEEMRAKALEAGALFSIGKPFTIEDFQQALEGILPKPE